VDELGARFTSKDIGYLLGYSWLTDTPVLALIGHPDSEGLRNPVFGFFSRKQTVLLRSRPRQ